jgi:hypothetical protein
VSTWSRSHCAASHPRAGMGVCREPLEGQPCQADQPQEPANEGEIMSYPRPLYLGDRGEPTAAYRRAGHAPQVQRATGANVHYLATGASTAGQFGLYRWEMGAGPGGPDPHFHRTISESFYILEGRHFPWNAAPVDDCAHNGHFGGPGCVAGEPPQIGSHRASPHSRLRGPGMPPAQEINPQRQGARGTGAADTQPRPFPCPARAARPAGTR